MNPALRENNYVYIPRFTTTERAAKLAREFFELERTGLYTKDAQAPRSPAAYNFLPFVRLLVEKVPSVSELCAEPLLPTYAYARIYKHGEVLLRHRNRDACEISLSLNLAQDTEWPIHIQKPDGNEAALNLRPGDAMMYLGCEADHWRECFTGQNHVQVFIHYVRAHGSRAYAFFDKAKAPPGAQGAHVDRHGRLATAAALADERPRIAARSVQKVGRNDACPCGSSRKYKHCHGKPD